MNRRSFFGLFGGAAAVPFVKPAEAKPIRRLVVEDDPDMWYETYDSDYGTLYTQRLPGVAWPRVDLSDIYGDQS